MKMLSVPSQLLEAYPSHCKYTRKRTIRSTLLFDATIVDLEMHQGTPCHHHQWPLPRVAVLLLASWHFHHQHALALGAEEATHHGRTVQGMLIPKTPEKKKRNCGCVLSLLGPPLQQMLRTWYWRISRDCSAAELLSLSLIFSVQNEIPWCLLQLSHECKPESAELEQMVHGEVSYALVMIKHGWLDVGQST